MAFRGRKDATSNINDGLTRGSMTSDDLVVGKIGGALDFDGTDDRVDWSSLTPTNDFTIEAWAKTSATHEIDAESTGGVGGTSGQKYLFAATYRGSDGGAGVSMGTNGISVYEHGASYMPALAVYSGAVGTDWVHVVVRYISKQPIIYLDGDLVHTGLTSPKATVHAPYRLGSGSYGAFEGFIDEVRISDIDRSAGWIKTSFNNQSSPAIFYSIGTEQGGSGPLLTYNTIDLGTTTVCNNCHSANGVANAKANWTAGIYEPGGLSLKAGNELWCATCHDEVPANSRKDGAGVNASNVVGDNTTYGYYVTGHNINCLSCHDAGKHHIDNKHRTYEFDEIAAVVLGPYVDSYRLKEVGGQPALVIPKPNRNPITNWQDFALCFSCHKRDDVLGADAYDVSGTNFWDNDGFLINSHYVHLSDSSGDKRYDSDWDGNHTNESRPSCIACHNVHGSPRKAMMRHGELISTYGTTDKVPGLDFAYLVGAMPGAPDVTATLDESIGGRMGSFTAVCNTCHNPERSYYRTPSLAPNVVNPNADPNPLNLAGGSQEVLFTAGIIDQSGSLYLDVVINLTTLLGNYDQRMYDDGTHGDEVAGDGLYSYQYIVPLTAGSGLHSPLIRATNAYGVGTGEAELEISVPGEILWDNEGADSNWSTPENWSDDTVPVPGDRVAFNHTSSADCVVDVIANNLASITLGQGFNGTVTLTPNCVDGVSNELTLTEDLTVSSGTLIIQGDPTAVNAASGGTGANPHGEGIIINAANVTVGAGGKISADGQGFVNRQGPGAGVTWSDNGAGGSYGGYGGDGLVAPHGPTYGSLSSPTALGSGGAYGNGGSGGGAVKLFVSDTLTVNGTISADGNNYTGRDAGGGSGGSIWIIADTLAGTGAITVDGGNGSTSQGGGGAGGRIALEWTTRSFSGTIRAQGGAGYRAGHHGTIWVPSGKWNELWNSTYHVTANIALAPGDYTIDELYIDSGVTLDCQGDNDDDPVEGTGVVINSNAITIEGEITASGLGFRRKEGPGAGGTWSDNGAGGSHGGYGGDGYNAAHGPTYGLLSSPTSLGSGGEYAYGGGGGGAVKLNVPSGTVIVNGSVSVNGNNYIGTDSGGGAGGSIWIIADILAGAGEITADGGNGSTSQGGGGAGGRIALEWTTRSFSGMIRAQGGTAWRAGHHGTVWVPSGKWNELWNSTYHVKGSVALAPGTYDITELYVDSGATLECQGDNDGDPVEGTGVVINSNTITIDGGISASGLGFRSNQGPGAGGTWSDNGAGGSYGGYGGDGINAAHASTYGSLNSPISLGSGGSYSYGGTLYSGSGAGAVKLNVPTGTVTINGSVTADGNHYCGADAGGGSGGSVWIIADTLAGTVTGEITADGGDGHAIQGGGGAGGRIALEWTTRSFSGMIRAQGGTAWEAGHHGTIWVPSGKWNELWNSTYHVNGSIAIGPGTYEITELYIDSGSTLECQGDNDGDPVEGVGVVINSDTITIDGGISASGLGFRRNEGPGAGGTSGDNGAGGSYGGYGGDGIGAAHASIYGSLSEPLSLGSGGAYGYGGSGGGAVKLNVPTGTVAINGSVTADGYKNCGGDAGGGSGGSIWIIADTLTGLGAITSDGGNGDGGQGGGGAGGRVAVYLGHNSSSVADSTTVSGGTAWDNG
jgi:hypothetical protein